MTESDPTTRPDHVPSALRRDIRLVTSLLGETLVRHEGQELLDRSFPAGANAPTNLVVTDESKLDAVRAAASSAPGGLPRRIARPFIVTWRPRRRSSSTSAWVARRCRRRGVDPGLSKKVLLRRS